MFARFLGTGRRRVIGGALGRTLTLFSAAFALWVVYANIFALPDALLVGILFVCGIYALLFLHVGATREAGPRPTVIDWSLAILAVACGVYFYVTREALASHITLLYPLSTAQLFFGAALLALTLEATRRTTGPGLTVVVTVFLAYNLWGHLIPAPLGHGYIDFGSFIDTLIYTTDGVFGVPIQVAASYVFLFVLFGSLLSRAGGAEFMFQLAAALTGRSPGGPAKIAILSSGMYGMISGSPTSDVATTGSVTIPIMKRLGYSARFAGAVEVAASTGGAAMPPVMGSAAFILAEYTGIDYRTVVFAALIPALLYYLGIYIQVHLRARRLGLRGVDQVDPVLETLKAGWIFVVPLIVITIALLVGYTPTYVAVFGSVSLLATSMMQKRTRMSPRELLEGIGETTMRMLPVAGACAAAGLVIGGLTMTGLSMKASGLVSLVAGSGDIALLLLAALITIILGLGMPTPSAYILAAVLVGPAIASAGLAVLPANMFLLYFALLSALTPPIAVAAFAAAAIADEDAMRIAVTSVKLAATGFALPFVFVWNPALLAMGTWPEIGLAAVGGVVAVSLLANALEREMSWLRRGLYLVLAAAAVSPIVLLSATVTAVAVLYGAYVFRQGRRGWAKPESGAA
ncbi:C4-dicarboxylate ABC transporter [Brevirhabdus pacifica]|uniref:C4-dicarboxylate ABC transporter n=1 Tax=Brevirhabdus pacifica TaxID=1267768 RepID=A0A1U7DHI2_9RHOB|nr:TRAP transporter fused permease subunit [Brevirhabdus pacifica]APX89457.1 C4-dicarboxylate ABC transporter [Brevirhabdus pacifica]PJJ85897.1 TRAP transporter 4TM/12TM fusion protein [Brevirhabdus pacifica]